MQSVYYRYLGADQATYDAALQCIQSRAKSFSGGDSGTIMEIVSHVLGDYPELFYVGQQMSAASGLFRTEVLPNYLYSPAEVTQLRQQLDAAADEILSACINDHQSEYDRVLALHDYLKCHLEYDMDAVGNANLRDRNKAEAHNIVGALLRHKCVCEGFAKAMKFLCDKIGLECWVVSGTGSSAVIRGPHAWNIVRINGYYHHVDVTWDNQFAASVSIPNYGYLNLSDEEIAKDHTWNRKHYPACPSSPYNYFRVNNALIDSKAQLEAFLYNSFSMEEEFVVFRVVRGSILEREINGCLQECVQRAIGKCRYITMATYQCGGIQEQMTFFIKPTYQYR